MPGRVSSSDGKARRTPRGLPRSMVGRPKTRVARRGRRKKGPNQGRKRRRSRRETDGLTNRDFLPGVSSLGWQVYTYLRVTRSPWSLRVAFFRGSFLVSSFYFPRSGYPRGRRGHHRPWEYHADKHRARNCDTSARVRRRLTPDGSSRPRYACVAFKPAPKPPSLRRFSPFPSFFLSYLPFLSL